MTKRFLNCGLVEVKEGDEIIRVALMETYDRSQLICKVDKDFIQLQENVKVNVERQFNELSLVEREIIMKELSDVSGSLLAITIKDMLKSEYDKKPVTEASLLFLTPMPEPEERISYS